MSLELLDTQGEQHPKTIGQIKKELVDIFFWEYLLEFKKKYGEPFVKCLGVLKQNFETEEEGELLVEYPQAEDWRRETQKFFMNSPENWFRKNNRCTFHLFCKHYGRFDHHLKEQRVESDPILSLTCKKCKAVMKYPRSHWLRYRNQDGKCAKCSTTFHVNDLINQTPTLTATLEGWKK